MANLDDVPVATDGAPAGRSIVTIALNVPGPVTARHLRDAGYGVTKVEPPAGDPLATFCPALYLELHDGIRVERLDLKNEAGRARMRDLLARADLFLTSQRPSALARLGLDRAGLLANEATRQVRHLAILGEVSRPEIAGHDLTYLARAGLLGADMPRTLVADVLGGTRAFAEALLLLARPPGSDAVVGLFDSLEPLAALWRHGLTGPGAPLGGGLPFYRVYAASEGRVAIAALESHFRARLYAALSLPPESDLTAAMATRTASEWEHWGKQHDVPIAACRDS
jgi:crotonobetainyl-CoA:carnitine CoA-transferase CaiB-like acyl-CoA transferase